MREATEIARLRLFLKMVAVVDVDEMADNLGLDPLPDIDFNIRCGNTLVGFANPEEVKEAILMQKTQQLMLVFEEDLKPYKRIENKAADIADLYERFKSLQQTAEGSSDFYEAKKQLNEKLVDLNVELDRAMARRFYGIDSDTLKGNMEFVEWKKKTQPFHWYSEFYDITVANGGFDVIIGNPPYVSMRKIDYLRNSDHFACSDLFGHVIKRVLSLMNNHSRHGFIVMHNIAFSNDFKDVRHELINNPSRSLWCTFYARIPSGLFTVDGDGGARVRNCIYITAELGGERYTSRLRRWFTEYRSALFQDICYVRFFNNDVFPMFNSNALQVFLTDNERKIFSQCIFLNKTKLYYQATGYNYLSVTRKPAPCYNDNVEIEGASKDIEVSTDDINIYSLLFNGKITLSRWLTYGDDFHVTLRPFMDSRVNFEHISQTDKVKINKLYEEFERRLPETLQFKLNCGKRIGSYNISKLWDITDQSDAILLKYLCNNPEQILEAIEDHISSCVISNRKENATE